MIRLFLAFALSGCAALNSDVRSIQDIREEVCEGACRRLATHMTMSRVSRDGRECLCVELMPPGQQPNSWTLPL